MLSTHRNVTFCWICGKDVSLEHCITDEQGRSVHQSCQERSMLLKAAARQTELWKQSRPKRDAA